MAFKKIMLSLLAPAAALVAMPAMAQTPAPASDASLPTCSAKVTDHCMQRSGGGHMAGHKMAAHHRKHHVKARRHHKAMKHQAAGKAAPKAAPAAPAKPKKG